MMKKRLKFFLIASVCVSLLCGIVATVFYIQYLIRWDVFDPYFEPSGSNYNPLLWVVIPISFAVGIFLPIITYYLEKVLSKVEDVVDYITEGP